MGSRKVFPEYSNYLYAQIANQYIGKEVVLPSSRKYPAATYKIEYVHQIPRSIQQRIAGANATSWNNMCRIYNSFAEEIGYGAIPLVDYIPTEAEDIWNLSKHEEEESFGNDCFDGLKAI